MFGNDRARRIRRSADSRAAKNARQSVGCGRGCFARRSSPSLARLLVPALGADDVAAGYANGFARRNIFGAVVVVGQIKAGDELIDELLFLGRIGQLSGHARCKRAILLPDVQQLPSGGLFLGERDVSANLLVARRA